jgi:hypothetical protein
MIATRLRCCLPILAALLTIAANRPAEVGFVDVRQIVASHPLHSVLLAYDREIAALQSTRRVADLRDPAGSVARATVAVQRDANGAGRQIARIAQGSQRDGAHERDAVAAAMASERTGDRGVGNYRATLARATTANLREYASSITQRTDRALLARQQQLREKELTLAFDLARRDAAKRLSLQLKLQHLHLDRARRARLHAELVALNANESKQVAAMRRADAAELDAYRRALQRQAGTADAQMVAHLRTTADANLGVRMQVLRAQSRAALPPDVGRRLSSFASTYRFTDDASAIQSKLRDAQADLRQSFGRIIDADRLSASQTSRQIDALKAARAALYRSMLVQIRQDAQRLARERHLTSVIIAALRPQGSVDLTGALRAELARFWKT